MSTPIHSVMSSMRSVCDVPSGSHRPLWGLLRTVTVDPRTPSYVEESCRQIIGEVRVTRWRGSRDALVRFARRRLTKKATRMHPSAYTHQSNSPAPRRHPACSGVRGRVSVPVDLAAFSPRMLHHASVARVDIWSAIESSSHSTAPSMPVWAGVVRLRLHRQAFPHFPGLRAQEAVPFFLLHWAGWPGRRTSYLGRRAAGTGGRGWVQARHRSASNLGRRGGGVFDPFISYPDYTATVFEGKDTASVGL